MICFSFWIFFLENNYLIMLEDLKKTVCVTIDNRKDELNHISQEIWKNPELNFEERFAHKVLTEFLEKEGFEVHKSYPLQTSFIARYGNKEKSCMKIGIICEYDALPGIGHACGHNLIAEAGIGAALGKNKYYYDVLKFLFCMSGESRYNKFKEKSSINEILLFVNNAY